MRTNGMISPSATVVEMSALGRDRSRAARAIVAASSTTLAAGKSPNRTAMKLTIRALPPAVDASGKNARH